MRVFGKYPHQKESLIKAVITPKRSYFKSAVNLFQNYQDKTYAESYKYAYLEALNQLDSRVKNI